MAKPAHPLNPGKSVASSIASLMEVTPDDLPLACPTPQMTLWNMHPKVYLALKNGEATCPYCGTKYILVAETVD